MSAAHAAAMIAERSAGEMRLCASEMSMAEIAGGTSLETTTRAKSQTRSRAGRLESRFKRSEGQFEERDARSREGAHQLKLPHSKHKRPRARSAHGAKLGPSLVLLGSSCASSQLSAFGNLGQRRGLHLVEPSRSRESSSGLAALVHDERRPGTPGRAEGSPWRRPAALTTHCSLAPLVRSPMRTLRLR